MTTLVVSDLHLGAHSGVDLLRRREMQEPLLAEVREADELLLLGDTLELRQGPSHEVLAGARRFFGALAEALGGKPVLLVPGNHDHRLIAPALDRRRAAGQELPLDLRVAPAEASPEAATIARWLAPSELEVAYPGLWLRAGVYATHGHYLDRHTTIPTYERMAIGVAGRLARARAGASGPDGYEAVLAPLYALLHRIAERTHPERGAARAGASARTWRRLQDDERPLRLELLRAGLGGAVGVLNRLGLGPLKADLSGVELRRASLRAMGEVVDRLAVSAEHVIFGHTHRPGPLEHDDADEWRAPAGARLANSGSWVYEPHFLGRDSENSPYWPGTCLVVDSDGPPRLRRLLAGSSHADLRRI